MKTLITVAASALAGALVVVACSDDSPTPADANDGGTCDCPAAEAPITAARLHRVDAGPVVVPVATSGVAAALCPAGELVIGGSCYIDQDGTAQQVSLKEAGIIPREGDQAAQGWSCLYGNQSTVGTAMVRAQALCLRP